MKTFKIHKNKEYLLKENVSPFVCQKQINSDIEYMENV